MDLAEQECYSTEKQENLALSDHPEKKSSEKKHESFENQRFNSGLKAKKTCWFYQNYNYCKFGSECRFEHRNSPRTRYKFINKDHKQVNRSHYGYHGYFPQRQSHHHMRQPNSTSVTDDSRVEPELLETNFCDSSNIPAKRRYRNFRVFTNSNRHARQESNIQEKVQPSISNNDVENTESVIKTCKPNGRQPLLLSTLNECDLQSLRETEINQLKRRYPNHIESQGDNGDIYKILFSSSDPDWSFDLKSIELEIRIAHEYPAQICQVTVLNTEEKMPSLLQKFLNGRLNEWLKDRREFQSSLGQTELYLRPFFRWLDRNLEQLFIEGLRKVKLDVEAKNSGIEFVPQESLSVPSAPSLDEIEGFAKEKEDDICEEPLATQMNNLQIESPVPPEDGKPVAVNPGSSVNCTPSASRVVSKKGAEVKLLNFELKEGAASLQCNKVSVSVRCTRCKTYSDIAGLAKNKQFTSSCSKCHQAHSAVFQPMIMHAYSSVLGYLHLNGCQAVDLPLVQCELSLDCLNCNKYNSVNGINYGQMFTTWCLFCNQKLCVSAQGAKFHLLQQEQMRTSEVGTSQSSKRKTKDPVVEVGKPLPNYGACKHYKKSHRWLRFPCCGKIYPCDLCHDEKETDHEMKYASRMLCGYCSKEQPYSKDKPCSWCSGTLTKKAGTHWEGGKGCRDRTKMSREDKQKYAGTGKTISRKAVSLQPKKKP